MNALFQSPKKPEPIKLIRQKLPKHIAIAIDPADPESASLRSDIIQNIVGFQVQARIPMVTFNILPSQSGPDIDALVKVLNDIDEWPFLDDHQVKISVLGRWYDMPERVVERIKAVISRTKDYDRFVVNVGINYDGQEELVDAISRIARQVRAQRVDPERITKEMVKDNLDTAAIPPPSLIITTGKTFSLRSFMTWDAAHAKIYFSNVPWGQFNRTTLIKALVFYQNTAGEKNRPGNSKENPSPF